MTKKEKVPSAGGLPTLKLRQGEGADSGETGLPSEALRQQSEVGVGLFPTLLFCHSRAGGNPED